jgi:hypothetical protein
MATARAPKSSASKSAISGWTASFRLKGVVSHHVLRDRLPGYHAGLVPTRLDRDDAFLALHQAARVLSTSASRPSSPRSRPTSTTSPTTSAWYFTPNSAPEAARVIAQFASADPAERVRSPGRLSNTPRAGWTRFETPRFCARFIGSCLNPP